MSRLIREYGIVILTLNEEADRLADLYVTEGIIPLKYRTDGVHIALAAVNDLDMIISISLSEKRKIQQEILMP